MSMFSVDINSANNVDYIRSKKGGKKKAVTHQPAAEMTRSGSIFSLSETQATNITTAGATVNSPSRRQVGNRNANGSVFGNMNFVSTGARRSTTTGGVNGLPTLDNAPDGNGDDLGIGRDASAGREAAADLKGQTSDAKSNIRQTESDAASLQKTSAKTKKTGALLSKQTAKFKEQQAKQLTEFNKLEEQRRATIRESLSAQSDMDAYNAELESAIMSGDDAGKIATLRCLIREKSSTVQVNDRKINVIGRSSKSLVNQMAKTSKAFVKTNKAHQKNAEVEKTTAQKIAEVANKIAEISGIIEMTGSIIENLGRIFKACAGIPFVGAALAAAGAVMEPIGATGKAVGQWGKTAAHATMAVAAATEGNLLATVTYAASAIQSGMSATASTKEALNGYKNLDVELKEVKADAAEAKAQRAESKATNAQEKANKAQAKADAKPDSQKAQAKADKAQANADDAKTKMQDAQAKELQAREKTVAVANKKAEATSQKIQEKYDKAYQKAINSGKTDAQAKAIAQGKVASAKANLLEQQNLLAQKQETLLGTIGRQEGVNNVLNANNASAPLKVQVAKAYSGEGITNTIKNSTSEKIKAGANNLSKTKKAIEATKKEIALETQKGIKALFSKEGGALVCQALQTSAAIISLTNPNATMEVGVAAKKGKKVSHAVISHQAQTIIAKTSSRMGYSRPGMFAVRTR